MGNITRSKNVREKDFNQVKELCNTGLSFRKISEVFGYSAMTISRIAKADTFKAYKEYHKRESLKRNGKSDSKGGSFEEKVLELLEKIEGHLR